MGMITFCKKCKKRIPNNYDRCPFCGSEDIVSSVLIKDYLLYYDNSSFSVVDRCNGNKKRGYKTKEAFYGFTEFRKKHTIVFKKRIINKLDNIYYESIILLNSKQLIHFSNEPLNQHFNHGSAKKSVKRKFKIPTSRWKNRKRYLSWLRHMHIMILEKKGMVWYRF